MSHRRSLLIAFTAAAAINLVCMAGPVTAKTITLKFAGRYTKGAHLKGYEFMEKAIKEYERTHPGIKIEYIGEADHEGFRQKLLVMAAGGTIPDVMNLYQPWVFDFAERNIIQPYSTDIANRVRGKFYPVTINSLTTQSRLYAFPTENQVSALLYNKKVLREAGIGVVPKTWSELEELSMKLTVKNGPVFKRQGFGSLLDSWATPAFFRTLLYANGGKFMEKNELLFNKSQGLQVLEDLRKWYTVQKIATVDYGAILTEKVAFSVGYPWHIGFLENKLKNNVSQVIGVAEMPAGSARRAAYHYSWGYSVAKASKHKREATQFAEWMATYPGAPDNMTYIGGALAVLGALPSVKNDAGKGKFGIMKEWYQGFTDNLEYAVPTDGLALQEKMDKTLFEELQPFIMGKGSAAGALDNAKRKIQLMIAKKK